MMSAGGGAECSGVEQSKSDECRRRSRVQWCGGKQDGHLGKQQRARDYLMVAISDVHQLILDHC